MKSIIFVITVVASYFSFAHDAPKFEEFLGRHSQMVNNNGEYFLTAEIINHKEYPEVGEVLVELVKNYHYGLDGMELKPFDGDLDDVIKKLDAESFPFFCGTMTDEWDDDGDLCVENTKNLLGDVVGDKDTRMYMMEVWGNYYGDWGEQVLIIQHTDFKQSLVIRFDMIHEI